jgi:hypothetical protein
MAVSDDMPGLIVHARSQEELENRLPGIVRDLLEADGHMVEHVHLERDSNLADFDPPAFIASACLQAEAVA